MPSSVSNLTAKKVACLISDHVNEIDDIGQSLHGLAKEEIVKTDQERLNQFVQRWHFTVTQQVMLREVLRKARARQAEEILDIEQWEHCGSAREVLSDIDIYSWFQSSI